jgi:hypothetical protein
MLAYGFSTYITRIYHMYEFFFAKIMGIQLNTHEYILGLPLPARESATARREDL